MIINPAAAQIIKKTFHFDSNRYYYEYTMCNLPEINVVSTAITGSLNEADTNKKLIELTKSLPDIDY